MNAALYNSCLVAILWIALFLILARRQYLRKRHVAAWLLVCVALVPLLIRYLVYFIGLPPY